VLAEGAGPPVWPAGGLLLDCDPELLGKMKFEAVIAA
jgi:hypothetical protein